jgi:hypothetical protein
MDLGFVESRPLLRPRSGFRCVAASAGPRDPTWEQEQLGFAADAA